MAEMVRNTGWQQDTEQEDRNVTIEIENAATGELTGGGRLTLDRDVVASIAGLAARDVDGIHSLGKSRLISFGNPPARGVEAEVGQVEAAFDLDVVIDYGIDIRKIAAALRQRISEEVYKMAGRKVVEVNINVVGLYLAETPDSDKAHKNQPRVR